MPTNPLDPEAVAAESPLMFVRCKKRFKDGKEHRYWSVVENCSVSGGGACWLALTLWDRLELDRFWEPRLAPSRQGMLGGIGFGSATWQGLVRLH